MKYIYYYSTNIGNIGIMEENNKLLLITFNTLMKTNDIVFKETDKIKEVYVLINDYLNGSIVDFSYIKLKNMFTKFEREVFDIVLNVKYGDKITYTEIAKKLGNENLYRSVGKVLNNNRFPILIPCHRVINKNGKIGSYVGDVLIKKKLLDIERNTLINIEKNK